MEPRKALFDTGASLSCIAPHCLRGIAGPVKTERPIPIKVGDGRVVLSQGECEVTVKLGHKHFTHTCVVVPNLAVEIVIGLDFIRHHKCLKGFLFEGGGQILYQKGDKDLELLSLGRTVSPKKIPTMYQRLSLYTREDYKLNPEVLRGSLASLGLGMADIKSEWFATSDNSIFDCFCTPENSIYKFFLPSLGLSYANPPWSHLEKVLTKISLEGGKVVLVTPDWEGVSWRPLLNDLTVKRTVVPPGTPLYSVEGGPDLPSPPWNTLVSLCEGPGSLPLRPELVRHLCRTNQGCGPSELTKRNLSKAARVSITSNRNLTWPVSDSSPQLQVNPGPPNSLIPSDNPPPLDSDSDSEDEDLSDLARPTPVTPGLPPPFPGVPGHTLESTREEHDKVLQPFSESSSPAQEKREVEPDPHISQPESPTERPPSPPISPTLPPVSPILPPSSNPSLFHSEEPDAFYLELLLTECDYQDMLLTERDTCETLLHMGECPSEGPLPQREVLAKPSKGWPVSKRHLKELRNYVEQSVLNRLVEKKIEQLSVAVAPPEGFFSQGAEAPMWTTSGWGNPDSTLCVLEGEEGLSPVSGWATAPEEEKSTLHGAEVTRESLKCEQEEIKDLIMRYKDVGGALPPPGSVPKHALMDLELKPESIGKSIRSRPYGGTQVDSDEIDRQCDELLAKGFVGEYAKGEYPKHCSPCFLVDKAGGGGSAWLWGIRR